MRSFLLTALLAGLWAAPALAFEAPTISDEEAGRIGRLIWHNESRSTLEGLTSWNQGEEFASLGIAHYIWFPEGYSGPFQESFPLMLDYLAKHGAEIPDWLAQSPHCPWSTREEFLAERNGPRLRELRELLAGTVQLQARFTAERLRMALPKLLASVPKDRRARVRRQFERVWRAPGGVYALVDYVNFKGEGTLPRERYRGKGWGLLQVLEGMRGSQDGDALLSFSASAKRVLARRVRHSPPHRKEARWMKGWLARLRTYRGTRTA